MTDPQHRRLIRSFVLREGRLTKGQQHALDTHWKDFGIDFSREAIQLEHIFHRRAPKILDIGSGMGDSTLQLAGLHPENDYIAIEVHRPGVGGLIRQAAERSLNNIRVINHDVMEVLRYQLRGPCLDEVYIFFPDPWPKKRHHKRRLINPPFLDLLIERLKPNARLYIATDWEDLAEHVLKVCDNNPGLLNLANAGNACPRPEWRPLTKFEKRGQKLTHPVWDFIYGKLDG